jgi:hypothetical protein
MSDYTSQIITAIEGRIDALTSYEKLRYYFDRQKNDNRSSLTGYAVLPGSISPSDNRLIKTIMVDQEFQIVLMDQYRNDAKSDTSIQAKIKDLFDKQNTILTDLASSKIGLSGLVLVTDLIGIDQPEVNEENKTVELIMNIVVKYRNGI